MERKKFMYILGINGGVRSGNQDASACLLNDGKLVTFAEICPSPDTAFFLLLESLQSGPSNFPGTSLQLPCASSIRS